MRTIISDIELEGDGEVDLSERGEKHEGSYRNAYLLERFGRMSFRAFWEVEDSQGNPRDVPGVAFQLSTFHLENEETGRAFHVHMTFPLTQSQTHVLRAWLGFMLDHWGEMAE